MSSTLKINPPQTYSRLFRPWDSNNVEVSSSSSKSENVENINNTCTNSKNNHNNNISFNGLQNISYNSTGLYNNDRRKSLKTEYDNSSVCDMVSNSKDPIKMEQHYTLQCNGNDSDRESASSTCLLSSKSSSQDDYKNDEVIDVVTKNHSVMMSCHEMSSSFITLNHAGNYNMSQQLFAAPMQIASQQPNQLYENNGKYSSNRYSHTYQYPQYVHRQIPISSLPPNDAMYYMAAAAVAVTNTYSPVSNTTNSPFTPNIGSAANLNIDPYTLNIMEQEYSRVIIEDAQVKATNARKQRPKKFKCPHCNVAFSNNGQLKGHIRIHTGERPFKCDVETCGKTFTRNEELTRHKRIHTGIRPYACTTCGKRFGRRDHLKKHMKTHMPPEPQLTQNLFLPLYPYLFGY